MIFKKWLDKFIDHRIEEYLTKQKFTMIKIVEPGGFNELLKDHILDFIDHDRRINGTSRKKN